MTMLCEELAAEYAQRSREACEPAVAAQFAKAAAIAALGVTFEKSGAVEVARALVDALGIYNSTG